MPDYDNSKNSLQPTRLSAGEFSSWLRQTRHALQLKNVGADVPCGDCTKCCRSSMFIHIKPEDTQALKRIPKALQFPAPGLPQGNVLMGYNEKGECPMLADNKCSIYQDRPQTCRDYDCRVFKATGIAIDAVAQPLIAEQVKRWEFEFRGAKDREDHSALQAAAKFLCEHKDSFLPATIPENPAQLAVLAIRIYEVYAKSQQNAGGNDQAPSDADVAKAVLAAMEQLEPDARRTRR